MIPPFNDFGYLPPGVHVAPPEEIDTRIGSTSELRRVQMESVYWMVELAKKAGVQRIILNRSFVTDIIEPNDVDCVLLFIPDTIRNHSAFEELEVGLPFLDIAIVEQPEFDDFVSRIFASDRHVAAKGMIEVVLWT
jgi:hypothetical protein